MADTQTHPQPHVAQSSRQPSAVSYQREVCGQVPQADHLGDFLECWWSDEIAAVEIFLDKAHTVATLTATPAATTNTNNGHTPAHQLTQALAAMTHAYADLPHHLIEDLNLHHTHRALTEAARSVGSR